MMMRTDIRNITYFCDVWGVLKVNKTTDKDERSIENRIINV